MDSTALPNVRMIVRAVFGFRPQRNARLIRTPWHYVAWTTKNSRLNAITAPQRVLFAKQFAETNVLKQRAL